jgi:hypothetical protein
MKRDGMLPVEAVVTVREPWTTGPEGLGRRVPYRV